MTTIDSKDPALASEGSSAAGGAALNAKEHSVREVAPRTLPPPEPGDGPRSAASLALERYELDTAIARRSGPRAELASLSGKLGAASRAGSEHEERTAAAALARALAARGTELDAATRFARRALLLAEDPGLREELAGWFTGLGEPLLAAATLRPLLEQAGADVAALSMRMGTLLARGGDARAAREAFSAAAREKPSDPQAVEQLAALSAWSPAQLSAEDAAQAYLDAAERREALGERPAAFENLMRAFEMAPHFGPAVERLAQALSGRGRVGAADEVRREQARAQPEQARAIHLRRLRDALRDGDLPRAVGAAFDARLDGELDLKSVLSAVERRGEPGSDSSVGFDELLERVGMHEVFAARLELGCDLLAGRERARARLALARLYATSLGRTDRAVECWIEALTVDPSSVEAKESLRAHALSTRDTPALVEALVRIGEARSQGQVEQRVACLRELWSLAEGRLADAGLAAWAVGKLSSSAADDEALRDATLRLAPQVAREDAALLQARGKLVNAQGEERLEVLSRLASILQGRPAQASEYLAVLRELVQMVPEERTYQTALERVLVRLGRGEELEAHLSVVAERTTSDLERGRLRLALSSARRRRGDLDGALRELAPLLDDPGVQPAVACMALLLAAQRGADAVRARALSRVATGLSPSLRAVLSSLVAESFLDAGELERAQLAAEQAAHADPSLARPVAVRARVGMSNGDRAGAEALERAMGVIVPRAAACAELSNVYERLGEPILALAWTQRRLALRPGDLDAARSRLARMRSAGDGSRLADTLAWLFSQNQPLVALADDVADALGELSRVEPMRSSALARRALDVMGLRHTRLREAVLSVADTTGERGLAIAVLERWLSAGSPGAERPEVLLDLSRRRRAAGDADGAARALLRAVKEGASPRDVLTELDSALPTRSSDGDLALLETRAEVLSAHPEADQAGTARAFRELGAALFDLASDAESSLRAWERAMALDPERGPELFAADVTAFIGPDAAFRRLKALSVSRSEPAQAARLLAVAAGVALSAGRMQDAFETSARALELDPARADVLALAERTASDDDIPALEGIYDRLAAATLGRYGERAVHYRAARQLERRREATRALRHAIAAFEAVPSEGVAYVTMARLAERSEASSEVVRAIERVALGYNSPELRAAWLRRAALFAGPSEEGQRQRIEVLLRALSVRGDSDLLRSLAEACSALLVAVPDERELLLLRFSKAIDALLGKADGPEGARMGIVAAQAALATFDAPALALTALAHAYGSDGDLEEYDTLFDAAPALARAESANATVAKLIELSGQRWSGAGTALLELGGRIAGALGDQHAETLLLVRAACKEPEKTELVRRAEQKARALGDPELIEAVLEAVPPRERGQALLDLAAGARDPAEAEEILRRAAAVDDLPDQQQVEVFERLSALLRLQGRHDDLEHHLARGMDTLGLEPTAQARLAAELAALIGARGEPERAIEVMRRALSETPHNEALWSDLVALARQARDKQVEIEALGQWVEHASDDKQRLLSLRELAQLLEQQGDEEGALERWAGVLELDENDVDAIAALERKAERQGDYETLVKLLARRATQASMVDDVRRIRLRRAAVLEQRLGRPDEACAELEALVTATGDNLSVLRVLADLQERLGAPLRAAALWLRASAVASNREEAADLSRRTCEAYLAGGDVEAARRVLEGMGTWTRSERMLELGVEVERRRQNPAGLSEALDDLATASTRSAEERAQMLVEAARASLVAGDRAAALSQALRAARMAPESAEPQLISRYLEYLSRPGPGDAEQARLTATELRSIRGELSVEQADLRTFLIAEALDQALGGDAGLRELVRSRAELGDTPLVALGIAERLERTEPAQALPLFERALAADLRELRSKSRTALGAARAAKRVGELDRALSYLDTALGDAETRAAALELSGELSSLRARGRSAPPAARRISSRPPVPPSFDNSSPTLLGAPSEDRGRYSERPPAVVSEERFGGLEGAPTTERISSPQPSRDSLPSRQQSPLPWRQPSPPLVESLLPRSPRGVPQDEARLAVPSVPPPSPRPSPRVAGSMRPSVSGRYSLAPEAEEHVPTQFAMPSGAPISEASERRASEPLVPQVRLPEPRPTFESRPEIQAALDLSATFVGHEESSEQALYDALRRGSIEAGMELVRQLEHRPTRAHDLVSVARRLALLQPGDVQAVSRLHDAALRDRDPVYARAVEHTLSVLTSGQGMEPPALSEQPEQPDAVRALLFREQSSRALEALSLVWEGAEHVFRRDPSTYGVTGLERVPAGAPTPLARTYAALARTLGLLRTPLFQRRSAGPVTVSLALLSPPAVILSGDVRQESAELRFHLGAMLAAATPQYALLFGSPESQGRAVLRGLAFAFGPPRENAGNVGAVLNLAEVLWESIPARLQRRLRELCSEPDSLDYDMALAGAKLAVRRAGFFAAGDLGASLRQIALEEEYALDTAHQNMRSFVRDSVTARNLYSLALGAEYAHTRFQFGRGGRS
jgi:tetratricopeptide (TPR) repeat protein